VTRLAVTPRTWVTTPARNRGPYFAVSPSACGEPVNAYLEAPALCRAAEDRGPGRTTRVTRRRACFCLHVRPRWVVLIGKVVVVAGGHVPIAY
jgi:hypothetical protein